MRLLLALILAFGLLDAYALEVQVSRMSKVSGYSERFDLKTSIDEKVILDCQSFIQGLLFGPVGENVIMLQEWECDELISEMKQTMMHAKKHCLELDRERGVMDSHQACPR